jgi:hypothetical protein
MNETCDDGGKGGCLPDCTGSSPFYSCTGGSMTSASVCVCFDGYTLQSDKTCKVQCGDGKVGPGEKCDDGGTGACKPDCSDTSKGY